MRIPTALRLLIGVLALSGCGEKQPSPATESPKPVADASVPPPVDASALAAYARSRQIDLESPDSLQEAQQSFLERERLVAAILATQSLDAKSIDADTAEFRSELIVRKYFNDFLAAKASDEHLKEYVQANSAEFAPYEAHLLQLLVKRGTDSADAGYAAVLRVQKQLAAGASLAEITRTFSKDASSGARGGEPGWVASEKLPTQVEAVVRKMKAGEVSQAVATKDGFVFLQLMSDLRFKPLSFDAAAPKARARIQQAERSKEVARLLATVGDGVAPQRSSEAVRN